MLTDEHWHRAVDEGALGMVHCVRSALPLAAPGGVGQDRQLLGEFHAASEHHPAGLHGGQGDGHQRFEEPLPAAGARRDPGQRRLAGQRRLGVAGRLGRLGRSRRQRPLRLMDAIDEHFGHPAHLPRAGLPEEIGPVVAFLASRRNSYMTGANVNVDGGSDFT